MKVVLKTWLLLLVGFSALACAEKGVALMTPFSMPDEYPKFIDIKVFERVNKKTNKIEKVQSWYRRVQGGAVRGINGRWYRSQDHFVYAEKVLSTRSIPKTVAAPKIKETADTEYKESSSVESIVDSGARDTIVRPKKRIKHDKIPSAESEIEAPSVPAKRTVQRKKPIVLSRSIPKIVSANRWHKSDKRLNEKEKTVLIEFLNELSQLLSQTQQDIHTRYDLCPVDQFEAEQKGENEFIYVPDEVVSGRIWILKNEIAHLTYSLEFEDPSQREWVSAFVRIERRMTALNSQFSLLDTENAKEGLYSALENVESNIQKLSGEFNPFKEDADKEWALRWETIALDIETWVGQLDSVFELIDDKHQKKKRAYESAAKKIASELRKEPWKRSEKTQKRLATQIYKLNQSVYTLYEDFEEANELLSDPKEYVRLLAFLGANENLRIYSSTIRNGWED